MVLLVKRSHLTLWRAVQIHQRTIRTEERSEARTRSAGITQKVDLL
jgi:hypothetical protein